MRPTTKMPEPPQAVAELEGWWKAGRRVVYLNPTKQAEILRYIGELERALSLDAVRNAEAPK